MGGLKELEALAKAQFGVVSREQLVEADTWLTELLALLNPQSAFALV